MGKINFGSWLRRLRFLVLIFLGLAIALMINFPFWAIAQTPPNSTASSNTVDQSTNQSTISPLSSPSSSPIRPTNNNELRGIWLTNVDSDVLFSKQSLEQAIKRLKRLKFNTIYPTVWNGGYTLYPSKVAQNHFGEAIDPSPKLQNRDMLAETIKFGHEEKLAVIPWFEYGLMTEEGSKLMREHPDWITSRKDGSKVFVQGEKEQHRLVWLNPAHPQVQKFFVTTQAEDLGKEGLQGTPA